MTTFSTRLARIAAGSFVLLGVAFVATPASADPGPAYPPSPGEEEVVTVDDGAAFAADEDTPADDTEVSGTETGDRQYPVADEADLVEEAAATEAAAGSPAPTEPGGRGAGPILVIVAAAALLGGAVVAVARRI